MRLADGPEPPASAGESVEAPPPPPGAAAAAMEIGAVLYSVEPPEGGEKMIVGSSEAAAAAAPSPENATGGRESATEAVSASAPPPMDDRETSRLFEDGGEERDRILELPDFVRPIVEGAMAEAEEDRVCGTVDSEQGVVAADTVTARVSEDGGKEKDGVVEPHDGDRQMVEATVAEEDDGMDGRVGGEQRAVAECTVAEENKIGSSDAELVVTVAVAGNAGEKGLEKEKEDAAVTMAPASRKQRIPRTSCYHGVTRHRWTGKYEAHLWDRTISIESRKRKGKQVYLGGYDTEEKAARAYDLAALKYWGVNAGTKLNFPISVYERELVEMENMNQDEWVASLRRKSTCFSRGVSVYRGVARRKDGKWQARVGSVASSRDIYLGAFNTEEEAAIAYDIAVVELRGPTAITNFDISNYLDDDIRRLDAAPSLKQ